jgi:hypothetical protein
MAALLLLLCPALAFGQSGADFIPEDATFALTVNSVAGLRDKGEKFIKEHGLKVQEWARPSEGFKHSFHYLRIKKGVDETKPVAIVLPNLKKFSNDELGGFLGFLNPLCFAVPIKDVGEMAGNFKLKEADLKDGKIHEAFASEGRKYKLMRKGKYIYFSALRKSFTLVPGALPVTGALNAAQKEALTRSDVAILFNAQALWATAPYVLNTALKALKTRDARDNPHSKALIDALQEMRFVVVGLSLDDGGKANIIATFRTGKDGAAAKKFLTALRAGPGSSDLIGLPARRPLFAFAARGDGASNVGMARALVNVLFDQARIDDLLPGKERTAFVSSLEKMYRELKGSRAALYLNDEASKQGRLALVGILDVDGPEKHLGEMPNVVKRLNLAAMNAFKGKKGILLSYEGKAEKLDGLDVHLLRFKTPGLSDKEQKWLEEAFGPDWGKVRIMVVGKKVVFLAGSNLALARETLANLKKGAKGLAGEKTMAGALARLSKERKMEIHLNLEGLVLVEQGKKPGPPRGLTSLALTVEEARVQLEIVAAKSDVKPLAARFGFADK